MEWDISDAGGRISISPAVSPLEYLPVEHMCGHFELRLMCFRGADDAERGYAKAANKCTHCGREGRPIEPNYENLEHALREKPARDATRPWANR